MTYVIQLIAKIQLMVVCGFNCCKGFISTNYVLISTKFYSV